MTCNTYKERERYLVQSLTSGSKRESALESTDENGRLPSPCKRPTVEKHHPMAYEYPMWSYYEAYKRHECASRCVLD